jgi:hypothetical protein
MSKKTTHQLLAILFFIIALASLLLALMFIVGYYSLEAKGNAMLSTFLGEGLGGIIAMLVGCFCFCRLGIRMLGTNRKFFEIPNAKGGVRKMLSSILFTMIASLLCCMAIYRIWMLFLDPAGFKASLSKYGTTILMYLLISAMQFWLAYKRRVAAFEKPTTELLGETF